MIKNYGLFGAWTRWSSSITVIPIHEKYRIEQFDGISSANGAPRVPWLNCSRQENWPTCSTANSARCMRGPRPAMSPHERSTDSYASIPSKSINGSRKAGYSRLPLKKIPIIFSGLSVNQILIVLFRRLLALLANSGARGIRMELLKRRDSLVRNVKRARLTRQGDIAIIPVKGKPDNRARKGDE